MAFWQQLLGVIVAVALLFYFWPTAQAELQRSREVENPDWMGALVPLALVVLFVIALIYLARG